MKHFGYFLCGFILLTIMQAFMAWARLTVDNGYGFMIPFFFVGSYVIGAAILEAP